MGCAHDDSAWVTPLGREAQAAEAVGHELKAPKAKGFTEGEAIARQAFNVGGDGER
jgi:hypothetical protein